MVREGTGGASAPHTSGLRLMSSGRQVAPALGPSWAACVDVRVFLSRPEIQDAPAPPSVNLVRCRPSLAMFLRLKKARACHL